MLTDLDDVELKIAGNEEDRAMMMPLLYVDSEEVRADIERNIIGVLEQFTRGNPKAPRMKPLDVIKVLMGIMSQRDSVKQFQFDGHFWGMLQEYDYEQLMNVAEDVVKKWYLDYITNQESTKRRKLN